MTLRKVPSESSDEPVNITLQPLPGHTDEEVKAILERCGAEKVRINAPGFITATIAESKLTAIHGIAEAARIPRKKLMIS